MRFGCFLFLASVSVMLPSKASARANGRCNANEVTSALREIASEEPGYPRFKKSMAMADRIEKSRPACVTDSDLAELTGQLRDERNGVRGSAAALIGSIGPPARAAIPALRHALAERPCIDRNMASAAAIAVALGKLGEEPPEIIPFSCRNTYDERRRARRK